MIEEVKQFKNHWTRLLRPSFQKKANKTKIRWTRILETNED